MTISVPRARLSTTDGVRSREWHSAALLPHMLRMTKQVEALNAGAYLSGLDGQRCAAPQTNEVISHEETQSKAGV